MTTTKRTAARKTATKSAKKKTPAKAETADASKSPAAPDPNAATTKRTALTRRARPVTLVTGGTGFLGSHLVRRLAEDGDASRLRVFATSAPAWLSELGVEVVEGSVTSPSDVARAVSGVSEIYHLAGRVSREPEDAHKMYALHVDGTRVLCDAARAAGVRSMVLASTSGTIAVTSDPDIVPGEDWEPPVELISRWPYYASKLYQERVALEHFAGDGRRLVIVNPSLLLGPGDDRLSSTKVVLDFLARKIPTVPKGGLSFVDARDAADAFRAAMDSGRHGERYLLGAVNWTFARFFARLERLTKVAAPRLSLPTRLATTGARAVHALYRQWKLAPPVEPAEIDMAEHFWYLDASKAARELRFSPRDPAETLQDTVVYVRQNFLGGDAFN
ncbi:MAG TPA: NAD-dependent epimerase/dehydratase family protein [Pyrinomonadaceae bacterium]|nr:NAD-dependent epimerase/dehydratase family protein [Pyrinomonadaceae bacterium]